MTMCSAGTAREEGSHRSCTPGPGSQHAGALRPACSPSAIQQAALTNRATRPAATQSRTSALSFPNISASQQVFCAICLVHLWRKVRRKDRSRNDLSRNRKWQEVKQEIAGRGALVLLHEATANDHASRDLGRTKQPMRDVVGMISSIHVAAGLTRNRGIRPSVHLRRLIQCAHSASLPSDTGAKVVASSDRARTSRGVRPNCR
jgi:hypothetical protein